GENLNGAEVVLKEGGNATGKLEIKHSDINSNKDELKAALTIKPEATPTDGNPVEYELRVKSSDKSGKANFADFKLKLLPQPNPEIKSPTDPIAAKPGQTVSVNIVGSHLEKAKIKEQTGLKVKSGPTVQNNGSLLTAEIEIAADALPSGATEKIFTVEVTNSNAKAPPATFKIKVTPVTPP